MSEQVEQNGVDVEALADALAERGPVKTRILAEVLEEEYARVRDALLALEEDGLVYRIGRTRGTRWLLG
jgi:predicted transcriptional regulator